MSIVLNLCGFSQTDQNGKKTVFGVTFEVNSRNSKLWDSLGHFNKKDIFG